MGNSCQTRSTGASVWSWEPPALVVGDRITKLNTVLDNIDQKVLSDKAYKEWLTFATVMRNTRTFGFTIGGFAALNKSTLIEVCVFILP